MTHYSTLEKNVTIHPFLPFNLFFSFSLILLYLYYPQWQCISSQQHYLAYSSWDSFIRVFHLFSISLTSSVTFWRLSELKFLFDANSLPKSKVFIISGSVCTRSAERSYERTFNKINKKISKTYHERTASNTDNTWQWGLWELFSNRHYYTNLPIMKCDLMTRWLVEYSMVYNSKQWITY